MKIADQLRRPVVRFTIEDAQRAGDEWRFNCGPGALCAILDKTPAELRPFLLDFEQKGYTNPTLMFSILDSFRVRYRRMNLKAEKEWPRWGLARIQWEGPWSEPGVPMKARYRQTHWIGTSYSDIWRIFDINCMCVGGWIPDNEWKTKFVPWLLKQVCPRNYGTWHVTHKIEVTR